MNQKTIVTLKYYLSISLMLGSLAFLTAGIIPFLISFPSGFIFFPPTEKYLQNQISFLKNKYVRVIVCSVLSITGLGIAANKIEHSESYKKHKVEQSVVQNHNEEQSAQNTLHEIPGIMPVDIYGNFEKIGFSTKKNISTDGSIWTNQLEENGILYDVQTYCEKGVKSVNEIRLSATRLEPQYNDELSMKKFLLYGCGIDYKGSDINEVKKFIEANYYNDKASIIIGGVRFTIYAPTEFSRMIDVQTK